MNYPCQIENGCSMVTKSLSSNNPETNQSNIEKISRFCLILVHSGLVLRKYQVHLQNNWSKWTSNYFKSALRSTTQPISTVRMRVLGVSLSDPKLNEPIMANFKFLEGNVFQCFPQMRCSDKMIQNNLPCAVISLWFWFNQSLGQIF